MSEETNLPKGVKNWRPISLMRLENRSLDWSARHSLESPRSTRRHSCSKSRPSTVRQSRNTSIKTRKRRRKAKSAIRLSPNRQQRRPRRQVSLSHTIRPHGHSFEPTPRNHGKERRRNFLAGRSVRRARHRKFASANRCSRGSVAINVSTSSRLHDISISIDAASRGERWSLRDV